MQGNPEAPACSQGIRRGAQGHRPWSRGSGARPSIRYGRTAGGLPGAGELNGGVVAVVRFAAGTERRRHARGCIA
ncbi:hypothetical protein ACTMU2_08410 [Cupriavidus basilensis]